MCLRGRSDRVVSSPQPRIRHPSAHKLVVNLDGLDLVDARLRERLALSAATACRGAMPPTHVAGRLEHVNLALDYEQPVARDAAARQLLACDLLQRLFRAARRRLGVSSIARA